MVGIWDSLEIGVMQHLIWAACLSDVGLLLFPIYCEVYKSPFLNKSSHFLLHLVIHAMCFQDFPNA